LRDLSELRIFMAWNACLSCQIICWKSEAPN
jgi:hypothetical protein